MICLESELENHNAEVDSSEEVVELIKKLGGNLTSTTCYENYGSKPNTPSFYPDQSSNVANHFCFTSSNQNKTYDCGSSPNGAGYQNELKARICYCIKGMVIFNAFHNIK